MRHLSDKTHLGRTAEHRRALLNNMSSSLFLYQRITTTITKAKYARKFAERMITFARRGDLSARRHVARFIHDQAILRILFDKLGPHFQHRNGGYTRIIHLGNRPGDAAPMVLLELVGFDDIASVQVETSVSKSKSGLSNVWKRSSKAKVEKAPAKKARLSKTAKA